MPRLAPILLLASLLAVSVDGCSLGNIAQDDCTTATECASVFGLGSVCEEGYCTVPTPCATGHDCRRMFGSGACVNGGCVTAIPRDPACTVTEPEDLFTRSLSGEDAPTILGGVFALEDVYDKALIAAARLAVREVNQNGGGINGRGMGIIFCDNGGPMNSAVDQGRVALDEHAVDYLAGTIGAPVIIGPGSSSDAIAMVNRVTKRLYPSVIISPSATSPALTEQPDRLATTDEFGLFWRTCPSDQLQGAVLAENVIGPDMNVNKVAVVFDDDPYGIGLSQAFTTRFNRDYLLIPYDVAGDVSGVGPQVKDANVDAVLVISLISSDTVAILKNLSDSGLSDKKYFFTDGAKDKATLLDPSLPMPVQTMIKSAQGTTPARPSGPNYDLFKVTYQKEFGFEADQYSFVAQTYDAGYAAAYGVVYAEAKKKDYDGRQVAEGLAHLSLGTKIRVGPVDWTPAKSNLTADPFQIDIVGSSGELQFDAATGEASAPIEVWGVAPDFSGFTGIAVHTPSN